MELTTLGDSGLEVSRIGLGLAAIGRPGYINLGHSDDFEGARDVESMRRHAFALLDLAAEAGVRYLDAARSYGRAEAFLAEWLGSRGVEPASVTIGSKWGYIYTAGWKVDAERHEVKDHSVDNLRRQAIESRELLGHHLNLYQIHSATLESGVLDDPEVLDELARFRSEGLKIGLSLSGPRQAETLRKAMAVEVAGSRLFDAVQATWNLLDRSAEPALAEAGARGMGVIIKEALANGRLTSRNTDPGFAASRTRLEEVSSRLGTSIDALALAAVLARPWVDVVLSGASSGEQLRSNLAATSVAWDERAEEALSCLVEPPEVYWSTRARLPWN
jgi:aryl-alcohol dehydrogenase-like predicted oxidoreductase